MSGRSCAPRCSRLLIGVVIAVGLPAHAGPGGFPLFAPIDVDPSVAGVTGIAMADLDGDGDDDFVAALAIPYARLSWFENDGNNPPTFSENVIAPGLTEGRSIVVDLIDNDGDLDIALVSTASGDVHFFESNGAMPPTFTEHVIASGLAGPRRVRLLDIDADNDLDFVIAETDEFDPNSGRLLFVEHLTPPTPPPAPFVIEPNALQITAIDTADIDGDTRPDIVGAFRNGPFPNDWTLRWYQNVPGPVPSLVPQTLLSNQEHIPAIDAADLDGDTDADIVFSLAGSAQGIDWLDNDGNPFPSFIQRTVVAPPDNQLQPDDLLVADLDDDGDMDVINTDTIASAVNWQESDGAPVPSFTARELAIGIIEPAGLATGDADSDGDTDGATGSLDAALWFEHAQVINLDTLDRFLRLPDALAAAIPGESLLSSSFLVQIEPIVDLATTPVALFTLREVERPPGSLTQLGTTTFVTANAGFDSVVRGQLQVQNSAAPTIAGELVVLDPLAQTTVGNGATLTLQPNGMSILSGIIDISPNGAIDSLADTLLTMNPGGLTIDQPASALTTNGLLTIDDTDVAIRGTGLVQANFGTLVTPTASLAGNGAIVSDVQSAGRVVPDANAQLTILGGYDQQITIPSLGLRAGSLDIAIDPAGLTNQLLIDGTANLAGSLIIEPDALFAPGPTYTTDVLVACAGTTSAFDVAYVNPDIPGDQYLEVDYVPTVCKAPGGGAVQLSVDQLAALVDFDDAIGFVTEGTPSDAALGDLNQDGFIDLAVVVPDPIDPIANPGLLVVLLNGGVGLGGVWNGFLPPDPQHIITVGNNPQGVSIGDLDATDGNDLVVSNAASDTLLVFENDGAALPNITVSQTLNTGPATEPTRNAIANVEGDSQNDIIVSLSNASTVRIYEAMNVRAVVYVPCDIPTEPRPKSIDPFDPDNDGTTDLAWIHEDPIAPGVSVWINTTVRGVIQFKIPTNDVPSDLTTGDLTGDARPDLFTSNPITGTTTVINSIDGTSFRPPLDLPVGDNATSLDRIDADGDGDLDLAVAAEDDNAQRVVRILRNDTQTPGQLVLAKADALPAGGSPVIVRAGDVDNNGLEDIVAVNDASALLGPPPDVVVLRNAAGDCPGDLTTTGTMSGDPDFGIPDGSVNLADLLFFVNIWDADLGSPTANPGSLANVSTTGTGPGDPGYGEPDANVDLADLLYFVNEWQTGLVECP